MVKLLGLLSDYKDNSSYSSLVNINSKLAQGLWDLSFGP